MNRFIRFPSQITRSLQAAILALAIGYLLIVLPIAAQTKLTAPITLDGRHLFKVSDSGGYSASVTDVLVFTLASPMVPLGEKSYSLMQIILRAHLYWHISAATS